VIEKGKPAVRRGRNAYGPPKEVAGLPNQPEQDQRWDHQEGEPSEAGEQEANTLVFVPVHPTPLRRMIVRAIAGPLLWLIALVIVLITLNRTQAIELGVLIAAASFALSMIVLLVLRKVEVFTLKPARFVGFELPRFRGQVASTPHGSANRARRLGMRRHPALSICCQEP
jgi:hypothetical protein